MKEHNFEYHSELPSDLVSSFKIDNPSETKTLFRIGPNIILQEFEDGTIVFVSRDYEKFSIYSNRKFNQVLPVRSDKFVITFD